VRLLLPAFVKFIRICISSTGRKKVITSLAQHLGDNIAAEPLDAFIRNKHQGDYIIRIVGKSFVSVVDDNPAIDRVITVDCLSEWIYLKALLNLFFKIYDYHVDGSFCPKYRLVLRNRNKGDINVSNYFNCGNLLEVFCRSCDIEPINRRPSVHFPPLFKPTFQIESFGNRLVIIHANSNNSKKDWSNDNWCRLINLFGSKDYSVIEIGLSSNLKCNLPRYNNYCGKLSLDEIAFIISKCSYFIGIDSAFAHFANAFNVPRLILLGHFNQFKNYLPYSGLSKEEEALTVIHHNGPVKELPFEVVKERILL